MENKHLINFCHSKLRATVSCNTCSSEGYEENNLLSSDPTKHRRGFMADRFIKPPVEITVTFKYPVNLSHVLVWPRVGQQKSSGFEVISGFVDAKTDMSERISSCYLSENEEGILFFCPRKFQRGNANYNTQELTNFTKRPFSWSRMSAVSNVKNLTFKITRTSCSSIPSLGKIEIWGQPGFHNSVLEKKEIWSLWEQRLNENQPVKTEVPQNQQLNAVPGTSSRLRSSSKLFDIPEEFLDALTFEMMSVPMVLPSGKVVDQKTLERHQDTEANWGRAPSDPFTGRPFTSTLHPLMDTALKSRIDHFLVIHQDREELRFVPRTLGRKDQFPVTAKKDMNASTSTQNKRTVSNSHNYQTCSSKCHKHNVFQCTTCKKPSSSLSVHRSVNSGEISQVSLKVENSRKRAATPEVEIISENVFPKKLNNRLSPTADSRDDNLDAALNAVLRGLPSFVHVEKAPQITPDQCNQCDKRIHLYKLPCNHLICRICLMEITRSCQPSCATCHCKFTSGQPVKYHPTI